MSGHSKWAGIKHKKALVDAKKGKLFSKLIREVTVAAKAGGGKLDANPALRHAVEKAKAANMPSDNIDRAIKKGTGELPGVNYEKMTLEGYGPGGVAIMVEGLSDNKNRSVSEIRNIFAKKGGNLAGAGSVNWIFHKKGYIMVNKSAIEEDKLMDIALEAGAEDLKSEGDSYEITTAVADFEKVKKALSDKNIKFDMAEITMIPTTVIKLAGQDAKMVLSLVESLEEHEDVQSVFANFDIPDEILQEASK